MISYFSMGPLGSPRDVSCALSGPFLEAQWRLQIQELGARGALRALSKAFEDVRDVLTGARALSGASKWTVQLEAGGP